MGSHLGWVPLLLLVTGAAKGMASSSGFWPLGQSLLGSRLWELDVGPWELEVGGGRVLHKQGVKIWAVTKGGGNSW